jgi:hypothetical protein
MTEPHHNNVKHALPGAPKPLGILLCLGALAGVLIWAKLRLVTDIPRSAYADPREQQPPESADSERAKGLEIRSDSSDDMSHDTQP